MSWGKSVTALKRWKWMFGIYLDDTMSLTQQTLQGHWLSWHAWKASKICADTSYITNLLSVLDIQEDQTPSTPHAGRAVSCFQDGDLKFLVLHIMLCKGSAEQCLCNKTDCHLATICFHERGRIIIRGRRIIITVSSKVLYIFFRHLSVVRLPETPPLLHLSLMVF